MSNYTPTKTSWKVGTSGNPRGRPPGRLATRTLQLRAKAKAMGCDPLEVMINEIRDLLRESKKFSTDEPERRTLRTQAVDVASKLAPFLHPRLASIELSSDPDAPATVEHRLRIEQIELMTPADRVAAYRDLVRGDRVVEILPPPKKNGGTKGVA